MSQNKVQLPQAWITRTCAGLNYARSGFNYLVVLVPIYDLFLLLTTFSTTILYLYMTRDQSFEMGLRKPIGTYPAGLFSAASRRNGVPAPFVLEKNHWVKRMGKENETVLLVSRQPARETIYIKRFVWGSILPKPDNKLHPIGLVVFYSLILKVITRHFSSIARTSSVCVLCMPGSR